MQPTFKRYEGARRRTSDCERCPKRAEITSPHNAHERQTNTPSTWSDGSREDPPRSPLHCMTDLIRHCSFGTWGKDELRERKGCGRPEKRELESRLLPVRVGSFTYTQTRHVGLCQADKSAVSDGGEDQGAEEAFMGP